MTNLAPMKVRNQKNLYLVIPLALKKEQRAEPSDRCIVYFLNGLLTRVQPEDIQSYYDADVLVSDGKIYDMNDPADIRQIPVPNPWYSMASLPSATQSLDYVLRMKAGNAYKKMNFDLCSALLWKSTELMLSNRSVEWSGYDYRRIINWHYQMNMPEESEKAKLYLERFPRYLSARPANMSFDEKAKIRIGNIKKETKQSNCDLVYFDNVESGCCEECEKRIGRVYSLYGSSRQYKPVPRYAASHGNFHEGCRCVCRPYYYKITKTITRHGEFVDAVESTQRPYEDLRTDEQKAQYEAYEQRSSKKMSEEEYEREYSIQKGKRLALFQKCKELCPELTPDTLTGFSRIRTQKTKRYLQIVECLKQQGYDIDEENILIKKI